MRDDLRALDLLEPPDDWTSIEQRRPSLPSHPRSASQRWKTTAVGVAVGFVAIVIARLALPGGGDLQQRSTSSWSSVPAGLSTIPAPPVQRTAPALVATPDGLVLWGGAVNDGARVFDDGYEFDLGTGAWTALPPSPLSARYFASAVWTGSEVLIWGGVDGNFTGRESYFADGAAYSPETRTWRPMAPSPLSPRVAIATAWTGHEMLVWGVNRPIDGSNDLAGAAYDPATNTWRPIATPESGFDVALSHATVWTGGSMIVLGAPTQATGYGQNSDVLVGQEYDVASNTWQTLPPAALASNAFTAAWAAGRVIAVDYGHHVLSYDPATNVWSDLPPMPGHPSEWTPRSAAAGTAVVVSTETSKVLDAASQRWKALSDRTPAGDPIDAFGAVVIPGPDVFEVYHPLHP